MFDGVAGRYDRTNTVLSFGQDRRWRRLTRAALELCPGERVLDVAAGTAVSSVELARSGAAVVACDFSLGMLRAGSERHGPGRAGQHGQHGPARPWRGRPGQHGRGVPLVAGDALALPFADASFDAVTIAFGLRNVADTAQALREMLRVTRPGGRLAVCEFSRPTWLPVRTVYLEYLMRALPAVARRVSSNPDAYRYLAESIREWPDQMALADRIAAAGWQHVAWRNVSGGIVALHRATRPG